MALGKVSSKQKRKDQMDEKVMEPALPVNPKVTGKGLKPDTRYESMLLAKFINSLMWDGKKTTSERVVYECMDQLGKKTGKDPMEIFNMAIEMVKPEVELKSKRVGGTTYQVPTRVTKKRQLALTFRWIIGAARSKKGKPMAVRLASEIIDASHKEGVAYKKREDTHKMAEANKAFAHFAY